VNFRERENLLIDPLEQVPSPQADLGREVLAPAELAELGTAWWTMEAEIRRLPLLGPETGFRRRWIERLGRRRDQHRRRQVILALSGLLSGAFLTFTLLGIETLARLASPAALASDWIQGAINARNAIEAAVQLLSAFGGGLPVLVGGVALAVALGWLSVLWLASMYRYAFVNLSNGVTK